MPEFFVSFLGFNVVYLELFLCFSQIKIHSFIHTGVAPVKCVTDMAIMATY